MSQLHEMFAAHEDRLVAEVAASPMTAASRAAVTKGVRRGRRKQVVVRAGLAFGVAVVVAGVAWGAVSLVDRVPAPAVSPTASPTVEPTSGPSPSASASPSRDLAPPGDVTVSEYLPSAEPLTAEVWDEVGPGWVLATFTPTVTNWYTNETTCCDVSVLYLAAPTGERYQVLELDPDVVLHVVSWSAGDDEALMCRPDPSHPSCLSYVRVNLHTGEATETEPSDEDLPAPSQTSPLGTWLFDGAVVNAPTVLATASGAELPVPAVASLGVDPYECKYDGWLDDQRLLFYCQAAWGDDAGDHFGIARVGAVRVATGEIENLQSFPGTDTVAVAQVVKVGGDWVAMVGEPVTGGPSASSLAVLGPDGLRFLPTHGEAMCSIDAVVGNRVYATWGCWDAADTPTTSLSVDDLSTGASLVLIPNFVAATLPEDSFESSGMGPFVIVGAPQHSWW